jgi:hypothetical protein
MAEAHLEDQAECPAATCSHLQALPLLSSTLCNPVDLDLKSMQEEPLSMSPPWLFPAGASCPVLPKPQGSRSGLSPGTSTQQTPDTSHNTGPPDATATAPMVADLAACIPLLLERRYDELDFALRNVARIHGCVRTIGLACKAWAAHVIGLPPPVKCGLHMQALAVLGISCGLSMLGS